MGFTYICRVKRLIRNTSFSTLTKNVLNYGGYRALSGLLTQVGQESWIALLNGWDPNVFFAATKKTKSKFLARACLGSPHIYGAAGEVLVGFRYDLSDLDFLAARTRANPD